MNVHVRIVFQDIFEWYAAEHRENDMHVRFIYAPESVKIVRFRNLSSRGINFEVVGPCRVQDTSLLPASSSCMFNLSYTLDRPISIVLRQNELIPHNVYDFHSTKSHISALS